MNFKTTLIVLVSMLVAGPVAAATQDALKAMVSGK